MTVDNRYPTSQLNVLVEEGLDIRSSQLQNQGVTQVGGQPVSQFVAQNLAAGQPVSFRAATPVELADVLRVVLSGLLVALVVGSGVIWWVRRRAPSGQRARPIRSRLDKGLVRQIAALDDEYAAGKINRFEYEARRAALKAELAEKMGRS
jgi:hypothetical protein